MAKIEPLVVSVDIKPEVEAAIHRIRYAIEELDAALTAAPNIVRERFRVTVAIATPDEE